MELELELEIYRVRDVVGLGLTHIGGPPCYITC